MKILIAILASIAITLALPTLVKDCSGNALLAITPDTVTAITPGAITKAYNNLLNLIQAPACAASTTTTKRSVRKWRSSDGVWHVSDDAETSLPANSTTIVIESSLFPPPEEPPVKSWMPFAIAGFCAGLCAVLYLLMWGMESSLEFFNRKPESSAPETIEFQERMNAGEHVEFAKMTPHEILGVDAKASLDEVKAAYESHLHSCQEALAQENHSEMAPDINSQILLLHQAYEAMTRRKVDKFLAMAD